jgi:hypothetical protein
MSPRWARGPARDGYREAIVFEEKSLFGDTIRSLVIH